MGCCSSRSGHMRGDASDATNEAQVRDMESRIHQDLVSSIQDHSVKDERPAAALPKFAAKNPNHLNPHDPVPEMNAVSVTSNDLPSPERPDAPCAPRAIR